MLTLEMDDMDYFDDVTVIITGSGIVNDHYNYPTS